MEYESLPRLIAASEEAWNSPEYFYDNSRRDVHEYCVIQLTLEGRAFWQDREGRRLVEANYAMLYTHDEASCYGYPPESNDTYRLQFVAIKPGFMRPLFDGLRQQIGSIVPMQPTGVAAHLINDLVHRQKEQLYEDILECTELLCRLLCAIWREQIEDRESWNPVDYGHYLLQNDPHGRLRIKELPERIGVSREHFIREHIKAYGVSPGKMHRDLRLNRVREILAVTTQSLEDIAVGCGFGSADALRRAYRAKFGENPTDYRQRNHSDRPTTSA